MCTNSKEWGQKQTDLRDELSRAHREQQGLPVFPGQGCKLTRQLNKASCLAGETPRLRDEKEKKGKKLQTSLKSPLAQEREISQEVGDPNLPEGTHGK